MDHEIAPQEPFDFAALYANYLPVVYHFFYRRVGNAQDAEDLTATTFSRALASAGRYREQGQLAAWLFSIARHTLQDEQRRRRARVEFATIEATLVDSALLPEEQALQAELACQMHDMLRQLPPDQRVALLLRFFGELDIGEIAAHMDRSAGSVKMLIYRAVARLRERYRQAEQALFMLLVCAGQPRLQYALQPVPCRTRRMR